jgi:hypothetical protein
LALIAAFLAIAGDCEWHGMGNALSQIAVISLAMSMMNPALSKIGRELVRLTLITWALKRSLAISRLQWDISMKTDGWLRRNYLQGTMGSRVNALLAASGYNLRCWRIGRPNLECGGQGRLPTAFDTSFNPSKRRVPGSPARDPK